MLVSYFSLSSRLLGELSPQLLRHMAAGVLRSEVWLSVHVPKPNYSLISTQVVPTVHSQTHTHAPDTATIRFFQQLPTQVKQIKHKVLIIITTYLPLISRDASYSGV